MSARMASLATVVLLVLLTGCVSTPRSRIYDHLAYFETLPEPVKENLRQGKIDIGYSKESVVIAYGKPDSVYTRRTAQGKEEIWGYWDYTWDRRDRFDGPCYPLGYRNWPPHHRYGVYQEQVPYERLRVVFKDDKVHAIEETEKEPPR